MRYCAVLCWVVFAGGSGVSGCSDDDGDSVPAADKQIKDGDGGVAADGSSDGTTDGVIDQGDDAPTTKSLTVEITSPTTDSVFPTHTSPLTIAGTCSHGVAGLKTNLGTLADDDCSDGSWSLAPLTVAAGLTRLEVTADDGQGNEVTDALAIVFSPAPHPFSGNYHMGVILLDYLKDGAQQTVSQVQEALFDSERSLAAFINQASYGQVSLTGDIFGWYQPSTPLGSACFPPDDAALAAAAAEATLANYDGFLVVLHAGTAGCLGVSTSYEPIPIDTPQGTVTVRVTRLRYPFYLPTDFSRTTQSSLAKVLIQSLDVRYTAASYRCGTAALSLDPAECTATLYGDLFSVLGQPNQATHPSAITKERLGWLEPARIALVTADGEFQIKPFETQSAVAQVVKIPLPNPITLAAPSGGKAGRADFLYLEYRGMTGLDQRTDTYRNIPQKDGSTYTISNIHGPLVRLADCTTEEYCVPYVLDLHPASMDPVYPLNEGADGQLLNGEVYQVPGNPMKLEIVEVVPADHVTIKVTYQ